MHALRNALTRHQDLIRRLVRTKGLPENRRLETDPTLFQENVKRFLGSETSSALILYALDDSHLCAFLWAGDRNLIYARTPNQNEFLIEPATDLAATVIVRAANRDPLIKDRVARMSKASDVFSRATTIPSTDTEPLSRSLSNMLFPQPFRTALSTIKHLSIVPVGSISSIPVAMLHPLGTNERVVDRFSVNFLLFASEITRGSEPWRSDFKRALVMGNPTGLDIFFREAPIPQTEQEARYVAEKYGVLPILGPDATTISFIRRAPDADLIYLATHGIAGSGLNDDPLRDSYIILADNRLPASTIRDFARQGFAAQVFRQD